VVSSPSPAVSASITSSLTAPVSATGTASVSPSGAVTASVSFSDTFVQPSHLSSTSKGASPSVSTSVSQTSSATHTQSCTPSPSATVGLRWSSAPRNPTSYTDTTAVADVLNAGMVTSMTCVLDSVNCDVDWISVPSVASVNMSALSAGNHTLTLTAVDRAGVPVMLSHVWRVVLNFIDMNAIGALSTSVLGSSVLANVNTAPTSTAFQLVFPQRPAPAERITITCTSNDTRVAIVMPTSITFDAVVYDAGTARAVTVAGVHSWRSEPQLRAFYITCTSRSSMLTGSGSKRLQTGGGTTEAVYVSSSVRSILGWSHSVIWPLFQDVWVLDDFGVWVSSMSPAGGFALTVSKNVTTLLVGDVTYRGNGHHFDVGTRVTIGGLIAPVLNVTADVRSMLGSLAPSIAVDGIMFTMPLYASSCVNGSCVGAAAYKAIVVSNSDGTSVSCPPYCPGYADSPLGNPNGAYYTALCAGYEHGASCLEPALASNCAFGSADTCQACPRGSVCPGGDRAW
jgi:hypothetical protein